MTIAEQQTAQRQMVELCRDLCSGLSHWAAFTPEIRDALPRASDRSEDAHRRRLRLLRAIVEKAERMTP